ncbi:hypothetical protein, partial [Aurantimonas sp. A3-2-R12]|uniref:hypothetical protein n=1 Tax=Aurantimonas sp. A3-2-R12 TaxID=3114362 RepID=UPI002E180850|nr:hypothetical protein [Aurantimonas sp. A3-2-R12]
KSDETAFPMKHLLLTENQTEHQMGTRRFKLFAGCSSAWSKDRRVQRSVNGDGTRRWTSFAGNANATIVPESIGPKLGIRFLDHSDAQSKRQSALCASGWTHGALGVNPMILRRRRVKVRAPAH